jgi:hypothetical protein
MYKCTICVYFLMFRINVNDLAFHAYLQPPVPWWEKKERASQVGMMGVTCKESTSKNAQLP